MDLKPKSELFLLPVPISEAQVEDWKGLRFQEIIKSNQLYFVENIRSTRRFISSLKTGIPIESLQFEVLDKDTTMAEIQKFGKLILDRGSGVIMSESGCPGVADPGSLLVDLAHQLEIEVKPVVGPSSILLALMGSGLSGQNFCFHGYLPIQNDERKMKLKNLEKESALRHQTQIFIETPYRNHSLWNALVETLNGETRLAFASDILGPQQKIIQKKVKYWRQDVDFEWDKRPTVFLFLA